jgi:hypothetical protein
MSWRSVQLKQKSCVQDQVIQDLFKNKEVKYVGLDFEFAKKLKVSETAQNLVLILNSNCWLSTLIDQTTAEISQQSFDSIYISINRYRLIGNDTDLVFDNNIPSGKHLVDLLTKISLAQGYTVTKFGFFDNDLGRYMNFVQPVTWIYGTPTNNI